jgi:hypothetical protein
MKIPLALAKIYKNLQKFLEIFLYFYKNFIIVKKFQIIHDAGGVDDNYFKMMDVEFVEGSFFTERNDSSRQIIIDENLANKLVKLGHWKDGAVGKRVWISSRVHRMWCGWMTNGQWLLRIYRCRHTMKIPYLLQKESRRYFL